MNSLTAKNFELQKAYARITELEASIGWVIKDASYKAPEQIDVAVTERWIARLTQVMDSTSDASEKP